MKTFDVLISEEVAYKYRIKAGDKELAKELAMDNHIEDIEENKMAESIDRCEVINCVEVEGLE